MTTTGKVMGKAKQYGLLPGCLKSRDHFPVKKSLTILPKTVIPKIMPVMIARKTARKRVNLKTRKKRGTKTAHNSIDRQPITKSFASSIKISFPASRSEGVSEGLRPNASALFGPPLDLGDVLRAQREFSCSHHAFRLGRVPRADDGAGHRRVPERPGDCDFSG